MTDHVEILLCIDNNFAAQAGAVLRSLMDVKNPLRHYRVWILNDGISQRNMMLFNSLEEDGLAINLLDVDIDFISSCPHLPVSSFFRLMAGERLNEVSKVIYLDSDLILRRDPAELYDLNLSGAIVAGVKDRYISYIYNSDNLVSVDILGAPSSMKRYMNDYLCLSDAEVNGYINTGVLLIDLNLWRSHQVKRRIIQFMQSRPGGFMFADQDVINAILKGSIHFIGSEWNVNANDMNDTTEDRDLLRSAAILHYPGPKPWNSRFAKFGDLYLDALARSPFGPGFLFEHMLYSFEAIKLLEARIGKLETSANPPSSN